jgi:D-proline reductase (dithiol) PrdB
LAEILDNKADWETEFRGGWLDHWQKTGSIDWKLYNKPQNSPLPLTPGVDLSQSRLLLVSTAGGYLSADQEPFDAPNPLGDYSIRLFPSDTPFASLAYAHDHFDHTAVNQDPQVLLPLGHLADLVDDGVIGDLAPMVISFMGYQPDLSRVVDELIPLILVTAADLQAQAVLLIPS